MEADFSGWATRSDIKCSDGRTINEGAFKHQHMQKVPLVWQHGHSDVKNVLGHALLHHRDGGTYTYAFFNDTDSGKHGKAAVEHGDVNRLSIWANDLTQKGGRVLHGQIREVSLVLSGANPGAVIDNVMLRHGDEDENSFSAIIHTDLPLEHEQLPAEEELKHADGEKAEGDSSDSDEKGQTVQEIYNSLSEDQKKLVVHMATALAEELAQDENSDDKDDNKEDGDTAEHGNTGDAGENDSLQHGNEEGSDMTKFNLFEGEKEKTVERLTLSHDDISGIMRDAEGRGSLKKAMLAYAPDHLEHGIQGIELLFPDYKAVTSTPEHNMRNTEWCNAVMNGATKRPWARIKSWDTDLTFEAARAKGYVKGNMKKEEWFSIAKRETDATTIYKKQKLDRDDIIDITDFDVVVWMKAEMDILLREECARAILLGDGRDVADEDKINEERIRPIALDDQYYTTPVELVFDADWSDLLTSIDAMALAISQMKGSGTPSLFTTKEFITRALLIRNNDQVKVFSSAADLTVALGVDRLIPVEVMEEYPNILGVAVNMRDYTIGMNRGGEINFFDDFDIDFNQYKYLKETRFSGALTKAQSAVVFTRAGGADVAALPTTPTWDAATNTVTIPTVTGIDYVDGDGDALAGGDLVVAPGTNIRVFAVAETGYYIPAGTRTRWSYMGVPLS